LNYFLQSHSCHPSSARPNTVPQFQTFDPHAPPLQPSPSPLIPKAWDTLLAQYPGNLPQILQGIVRHGCLLGYTGPETFILSKNLQSATLDPDTITTKLYDDLQRGRVIRIEPKFPYISSPLGLVPKHDGGFRRIHHLSHPRTHSVNFFILEAFSSLQYASFQDILDMVIQAGKGCILIKKDIQDAFRNIAISPAAYWLLGFRWDGEYYSETCLPFGLSTAPFLFNLFSEAFHWILESWLHIDLVQHLLDDFVFAIPRALATPQYVSQINLSYKQLTDALGLPRNDKKDAQGTTVTVFGIEIDTIRMIARLPEDKLKRAIIITAQVLEHRTMTLEQAQRVGGYLTFCARVVQLGWVYMRKIWNFIHSFPPSANIHMKRRYPPEIKQDLQWWNHLLPRHNGVIFFDSATRRKVHLFTDASHQGMGGFFCAGGHWPSYVESLPQQDAFQASMDIDPADGEFDINPFELGAILLALRRWGFEWKCHQIIVHTDSNTAATGLTKHTLRGASNPVLRQILLLAAELDIVLTPYWIPGAENQLADALSRFDTKTLANLCPHWQIENPSNSMILRPSGFSLLEISQPL
jgi:ribonuclease HI